MSLRIAQVATSDIAFRYLLLDQLCLLQQCGHEVICISNPEIASDYLRNAGFTVMPVAMKREPAPVADLVAIGALTKLFRKLRVDVVHSHTPKAGILAPAAARLAGVPFILHTVHGLLVHDSAPPLWRGAAWIAEKWTASCSHYLLMQSREDCVAAPRLRLSHRGKLRFLGNGIDIARFAQPLAPEERSRLRAQFGFRDEHVVIGMVGRLVREKGYLEFVAAAEQIAATFPQIRFLIVAPRDADQSDSLNPGIFSRLTARSIVCLDWSDHLPDMYAAIDILAFPSHREGVPRVCMEAVAAGCAVIATDIRGCREVIAHGETGLLVPSRDSEALRSAMEFMISHPELRAQMAEHGRSRATRDFASSAVLHRLANVYQAIAAAATSRRGLPAPLPLISDHPRSAHDC
jgi:glycosyltransferase involved in cell wall biosynthesis